METLTLGKYPLMIIRGDDVTYEQADEIIVRTNNWGLDSLDADWTDLVYRTAGIEMGTLNLPHPLDLDRFNKTYRVLDLEHTQTYRIMTRSILGPHGWCDWDGKIEYQLPVGGKWPEMHDLVSEWNVIAHTFPFLNMKVQFTDQDLSDIIMRTGKWDETVKPHLQIRVKDGVADADLSPEGHRRLKIKYQSRNDVRTMSRRASSILGQHGVPIDRLREALDRVSPL